MHWQGLSGTNGSVGRTTALRETRQDSAWILNPAQTRSNRAYFSCGDRIKATSFVHSFLWRLLMTKTIVVAMVTKPRVTHWNSQLSPLIWGGGFDSPPQWIYFSGTQFLCVMDPSNTFVIFSSCPRSLLYYGNPSRTDISIMFRTMESQSLSHQENKCYILGAENIPPPIQPKIVYV